LKIATRSSALAVAQASAVADRLVADGQAAAELVTVENDPGASDKERFVRAVERAVLDRRAEFGVHSAKDLPGRMTAGLAIGAVPPREDPRDALIGPATSLEALPEGARVGTASLRRRAQLLALRPDLRVVEIHGNVDTRLAKLRSGEADALVLAVAGLKRLGREPEIAFTFDLDQMVPAPGQGALVVQCRSGDAGGEALADVGEHGAERDLLAERAAVATLGADCSSPVGVYAREVDGRLVVDGFVGLPDGSEWIRDRLEGDLNQPEAVGRELARRMVAAGAREILDRAAEADSAGNGGEG
jgi:hydroxymethylbilane synthase